MHPIGIFLSDSILGRSVALLTSCFEVRHLLAPNSLRSRLPANYTDDIA